jgi:hypothetical protein
VRSTIISAKIKDASWQSRTTPPVSCPDATIRRLALRLGGGPSRGDEFSARHRTSGESEFHPVLGRLPRQAAQSERFLRRLPNHHDHQGRGSREHA